MDQTVRQSWVRQGQVMRGRQCQVCQGQTDRQTDRKKVRPNNRRTPCSHHLAKTNIINAHCAPWNNKINSTALAQINSTALANTQYMHHAVLADLNCELDIYTCMLSHTQPPHYTSCNIALHIIAQTSTVSKALVAEWQQAEPSSSALHQRAPLIFCP